MSDDIINEMLKVHVRLINEANELLQKYGNTAVDYLTEDHVFTLAISAGVGIDQVVLSNGKIIYQTVVPVAISVVDGKYHVAVSHNE